MLGLKVNWRDGKGKARGICRIIGGAYVELGAGRIHHRWWGLCRIRGGAYTTSGAGLMPN